MENDAKTGGMRKLFHDDDGALLNIGIGKALVLLGCCFVVCYVLTSLIIYMAMRAVDDAAAGMRISTVIQDVLALFVPAVATAVVASRRPAQLLSLMNRPGVVSFVLMALLLVVSVPAMDAVIYWNYHWSWLPASVESLARGMEDTANATIALMLGDSSAAALILNVLIVGVAAGLCEELLFRGAFLGLLLRTRLNKHAAVWIVAFVFSAMHFQLFGFVPRMLLGAYFGYLLVWSRSLWLPVVAHALNNSVYVVTSWVALQHSDADVLSEPPVLWSLLMTVFSLIATVALLYVLCRQSTVRSIR